MMSRFRVTRQRRRYASRRHLASLRKLNLLSFQNNLRLWESKPVRGFDFNSFNAGDYERAVQASNDAETITSVLYPNDNTMVGKELRLKQQYFWTAASLADILRRFKNLEKPIEEFADYVAIQLNDTHPTLAIPELMRLLVDEEDVPWDRAWKIVCNTFFFTNHTVLPVSPISHQTVIAQLRFRFVVS